jgi:hypothetical protein
MCEHTYAVNTPIALVPAGSQLVSCSFFQLLPTFHSQAISMQPPESLDAAVDPLAEKAREIENADDESTQQRWANVRKDAIMYLSEKKQRWQRLQDERSHRLKEVSIYVVFVVLVTIVALTSRNTEVRACSFGRGWGGDVALLL